MMHGGISAGAGLSSDGLVGDFDAWWPLQEEGEEDDPSYVPPATPPPGDDNSTPGSYAFTPSSASAFESLFNPTPASIPPSLLNPARETTSVIPDKRRAAVMMQEDEEDRGNESASSSATIIARPSATKKSRNGKGKFTKKGEEMNELGDKEVDESTTTGKGKARAGKKNGIPTITASKPRKTTRKSTSKTKSPTADPPSPPLIVVHPSAARSQEEDGDDDDDEIDELLDDSQQQLPVAARRKTRGAAVSGPGYRDDGGDDGDGEKLPYPGKKRGPKPRMTKEESAAKRKERNKLAGQSFDFFACSLLAFVSQPA
jgi:hypothetical protein